MALAGSGNWPQWRGDTGRGASDAKAVPLQWTETEGVLWRVPLPGRSSATPVLWNDRLFVSSPDGAELYLVCISTNGEVLWKRQVGTGNRLLGWNSKNNFATPSPVTDGVHVWILVGSGDLACFDFEGNRVWSRSLTDDHGPITSDFGLGCSPLLVKDRLIFPCIHRGAESYVLAIDKATGKDLWKVFRPTSAKNESKDAYSSPALYEHPDGRADIVLCAADVVTAYDLMTGAELWRHGDINLTGNDTLRIIVTPVTTADLIYVTSAKRGPVYAIRPGGKGDVTQSHRVWSRLRHTPDIATPAVAGDLFFMVQEVGVVTCLDAKTGEEFWSERVGTGLFGPSPLVADGKLFVTSEQGKVYVLAADKAYKLLATNDLGDFTLSSPVPADGRLYFRTEKALICIGSENARSGN
jgi:outer membrane protein assembly factor BamB